MIKRELVSRVLREPGPLCCVFIYKRVVNNMLQLSAGVLDRSVRMCVCVSTSSVCVYVCFLLPYLCVYDCP